MHIGEVGLPAVGIGGRSDWCKPSPVLLPCKLQLPDSEIDARGASWARAVLIFASPGPGSAIASARTTHSTLSDSSFPSSSATAYRPVRASNDSTRARLPLCSGLATSRCTSTRVPAGSNRAAADAVALAGGLARMLARALCKLGAVASIVGWACPSTVASTRWQNASKAWSICSASAHLP